MAKKKKKLKTIKTPAKLSFLGYLGDVQGCGTIRCIYPYFLLNHYREKKVQVITTYMSNFVGHDEFYKNFTFVQFQRSATKHHLQIFVDFKTRIQKKFKVPMIYEIDDMLIDIPEWNYASKYYKQNEKFVKQMLSMADGVVVSTPYLGNVYKEFNKNIKVVPNHLPKFIWGDIFPAHEYYEGGKIKILWAGSQNHFANPAIVKDAKGGDFGKELMNFIRKTADVYDWHLMGAMPEELKPVKKIKYTGWANTHEYPKIVKDIEPDICIAPLIDNHFNRCKSNIKQLEYTAMGAPGVFSKTEPYKNCVLQASTDEEMIDYIERLANDIDYRANVWKKERDRVGHQLWWEEGSNLKKYINSYLGLFGQKLP